jgi:hypothetical protein
MDVNGLSFQWLAIGIALIVAGIVVWMRFPRARRWVLAAISVAVGLIVAVPFIAAAALQNIDTDGSLEPVPLAIGVASAILGVVIAGYILIRR